MQPINGYVVSHIPECGSTSDELKQLVANKQAGHGHILRADYQLAGHGQGNNIWESERGKNILMSINLNTSHIRADEQAYFNYAISLAVVDMVGTFFPDRVKIKWPNDIYLDDKKIAGILIENSIQGDKLKNSMAGIGININQLSFQIQRAVSIAGVTGTEHDLDHCMEMLLLRIHSRFDELSLMLRSKLRNEYQRLLYRLNEEGRFRVGEREVKGIITGVDDTGRLRIMIDGEVKHYNKQEIVYIHD